MKQWRNFKVHSCSWPDIQPVGRLNGVSCVVDLVDGVAKLHQAHNSEINSCLGAYGLTGVSLTWMASEIRWRTARFLSIRLLLMPYLIFLVRLGFLYIHLYSPKW